MVRMAGSTMNGRGSERGVTAGHASKPRACGLRVRVPPARTHSRPYHVLLVYLKYYVSS